MKIQAEARTTEIDQTRIQNGARPSIHKFKTENNRYVFDVSSGEIFRVDEVTWEIIEDSYLDRDALVSRYTPKFTPGQISAAYDEILQARVDDGYFIDYRPEVGVSLSRKEIDRLVDTSREQITLNVTNQCNFRCAYCVYTYDNEYSPCHGNQHMSWETARAAIDDYLLHSQEAKEPFASDISGETRTSVADTPVIDSSGYIGFYGGEPLLNFALIKKCVEYVHEKAGSKRLSFGVSTNGYLLKGEVADFLAENKFHVRVSFDGPPAVHDRQRRTVNGMPTWSVIVDNVRRCFLKHANCNLSLAATIGPAEDVQEVIDYFATASWIPPDMDISIMLASEPYPGYDESVSGGQPFPGIQDVYQKYLCNLTTNRAHLASREREIGLQKELFGLSFQPLHMWRRFSMMNRHSAGPFTPAGPCVPGVKRTCVLATGEYSLCEKACDEEPYQIGHASTGIDKDRVYAIYKEFVESTREQCERCWCLPMCPVGCQVSIARMPEWRTEGTGAAKDHACADSREWLHDKFVDYCSIMERNPQAFDSYLQSH